LVSREQRRDLGRRPRSAFDDVAVGIGNVVRAPAASDVRLERLAGRVEAVAVELDDEAVLRPGAVDLVAVNVDVRARPRQAVVFEQGEERLLELAEGDVGPERAARACRSPARDGSRSPVAIARRSSAP
jgi:hypothetical protein